MADDAGEVLTLPELCDLLKIKERTARKWIVEKGIPHVKLGGLLRFRRASVMDWLAAQERQTVNEGALNGR